MAELYQAYGFSENESFAPKNDYYEDRHETERPMYKEPGHQPSQQVQEYSQSIPQIQQPQLAQQPVQMQQSQQVAQQGHQGHQGNQGQQVPRRYPSYSFSDRMAMKRSEVIKLAIFSLVIVLAISIDRLGTHYLSKYLSDNIFTDIQEFMLRLSYPVLVFLLLWIIKSL
jgi:hypothetical protein